MVTCQAGHESASDDFCDVCGIRIGAPSLSSADSGPDSAGPVPPAGGVPGRSSAPAEDCPRCGSPRDGQFCEDCGWNFADGTGPAVPPAPAVPPPPAFPPVSGPAVPLSPPAPVPAPGPGDTRYDLTLSTTGPQADAGGPQAGGGRGSEAGAGTQAAWSATVTADRAYYDAVREATGPDADGIDFPSYCPERRFRLTGGEVRVGRRSTSRGIEPEIDLTGPPADPGVSRLHAVLIAGQDGTWSVLDPGSANGTLVNGSEIEPNEPVKLGEGDRVNLGAWTLLVVSRDN